MENFNVSVILPVESSKHKDFDELFSKYNSLLPVLPLNTPFVRAIAPPELQRDQISHVAHQNFAQLAEQIANYLFKVVSINLFPSKRNNWKLAILPI